MRTQIKLGRVFGVKIGLHYTWVIIALLITLSLASHFHSTNEAWSALAVWSSAVLTGALFFTSIIAHELAHASVAKSRGLAVRSITLFAFGGVAQIETEAPDAKTEFRVGIAGPIASVLIGALCLALAYTLGWRPSSPPDSPLFAMLVWLGYINLMLAAFNMIPGFPLDGGRVLRAAIWWVTGNADRATRIASRCGQFVAYGFIALGIVQFASGAGIGGLWIAFIGWFLLDAARATYADVDLKLRLEGIRAGDVMLASCATVDGNLNLQTFVNGFLLRGGATSYAVMDGDAIAGIITPQEVKRVERTRWPYTTVYDAMSSLEGIAALSPDTPVSESLQRMARSNTDNLPVLASGRLVGILTREQILRLLRTRSELGL